MRTTALSIGWILSVIAGVPAAAQQAAFEELLPQVAAYEVGDSEQPLAEMHKLVALGSASP